MVEERITAIRKEHGNDAVAIYLGNPTVHNLGAMLYAPQLARALRTRNRFSATSVDQLPHHFTSWAMYGHQLLLPVPDVDHTEFFLMFGGNPMASNGSIMTSPDIKKRLAAIRARGGRIVVVDPRRTETAKVADQHIFIRPGTDGLMLAAMVQTLYADGVTPGRLAEFTTGIETLGEAFAAFTPEAVAPVCGVDAEIIRQLTRDFAAASAAVCHGRMGVSTQAFGGLCQWLVQAINVLTGNLDRVGGSMFTKPAVAILQRLSPGRYNRWRSRVRGLPEFGGELPVSVLAEEIRTPGDGRIRALITNAGNPVLSTPNGAGLSGALDELDFMVSIDPYINETTRHADLILPPVSPLERDHYDLVFNALAVRNYARYSKPVFPKPADGRHDWEILSELRTLLTDKFDIKNRFDAETMHRLGTRGQLAVGLRTGPYGKGFNPFANGLTLSRLEASPHGMDLGPLQPCLPDRLRTRNRKIALAPQLLLDDVARLASLLAEGAHSGMLLIGRRHVRSCNSWLHNSERLVRGKDRCTLMVHPEDAGRLGLSTGDQARVKSNVGELVAPVEVTDAVMVGVVSLPHGYGHNRNGTQLDVASRFAGVSVNDLTDPAEVDRLTGNAVLNGVPVSVEPFADAAPA
jgi:anaerobic selenocysteine-containing dehydrogenase